MHNTESWTYFQNGALGLSLSNNNNNNNNNNNSIISISVHLKELGKPTKGKNANKNQGKSLEKDVK